jgi:hypothetical protein
MDFGGVLSMLLMDRARRVLMVNVGYQWTALSRFLVEVGLVDNVSKGSSS